MNYIYFCIISPQPSLVPEPTLKSCFFLSMYTTFKQRFHGLCGLVEVAIGLVKRSEAFGSDLAFVDVFHCDVYTRLSTPRCDPTNSADIHSHRSTCVTLHSASKTNTHRQRQMEDGYAHGKARLFRVTIVRHTQLIVSAK